MKKLLTLMLLSGTLMFNLSITSHASDDTSNPLSEEMSMEVNLETFDFSKPFYQSTSEINEDGEEVTLTTSYMPSITRGSQASPGVWTSSVTYKALGLIPTMHQSFKYDVTKSGSTWGLSNPREGYVNAVWTTFSNEKEILSRRTATSTYPAEAYYSVHAKFCDNQWVTVASATKIVRATLNNNGWLETSTK